MTAAVGGSAQGGAETLLKANLGRTSPRNHREQSNSSDDTRSQSDEKQVSALGSKDKSGDAKVSRAEKGASRRRADDQSDDDNATFEDTFEDIEKDAPSEAAQASTRSQPVLPNLAMAQLLASSDKAQSVAVNENVPQNSQTASRPTPVLKQASILALMNTRDRLLSNTDDAKGAETMPTQSLGDSNEPVDRILATVDRRETHWNFDSKVMADSGAKLSQLQSDAGTLAQAANALGAAVNEQKSQNSEFKSTGEQLKSAQMIAASNADMPSLTSGNNGGSAGANHGDQGSQQSQKSVSADAALRRFGNDDTAAPIARVFSLDAAANQAPASVTDQVRTGVIGSLTASDTNASANVQQPEIPVRPTANTVLRTLDLTLSPPDLGSVKLHMSLKDNSLSIEAETSKASTAKLLGDDRVNLENGLRDAGYDVSSVKITDASASSSANSNNWQTNGSPSRDGDQARSNSSGRQDGEMQRRDDGSPSDQAQRRPKDNRPQQVSAEGLSVKTGNAVYI